MLRLGLVAVVRQRLVSLLRHGLVAVLGDGLVDAAVPPALGSGLGWTDSAVIASALSVTLASQDKLAPSSITNGSAVGGGEGVGGV